MGEVGNAETLHGFHLLRIRVTARAGDRGDVDVIDIDVDRVDRFPE